MKSFIESTILFTFSLFICTITVYSAAGVDPIASQNALSNRAIPAAAK